MLFTARIASSPLVARRVSLACKLHAGGLGAHLDSHILRVQSSHKRGHHHQSSQYGVRALHSPSTAFNGPKEEIRLTGAEEMLLPVVYLKAEDSKSQDPILGDPFSQQLLDACAIDYSRTHFTRDYRYITWVTTRAKQFDRWCEVIMPLCPRHGVSNQPFTEAIYLEPTQLTDILPQGFSERSPGPACNCTPYSLWPRLPCSTGQQETQRPLDRC